MNFTRGSGILLHITSLPSRYGIGDVGEQAHIFVDFLKKSRQKFWQILPIGPVGVGGSPYQSFSTFAGNPLLIDIDGLVDKGLLHNDELLPFISINEEEIQYDDVKEHKKILLRLAFKRFKERASNNVDYLAFVDKNSFWLETYGLFMALYNYFGDIPWNCWETSIAFKKENSIKHYKKILKDEIEYHSFCQYIFFNQWTKLKQYAENNGIKIIGDMPIFAAYNSSDVWANPHMFNLNRIGDPITQSGVPPDYFSETGQLWGNPHYRWDEMEKDDYLWWRQRFSVLLRAVDIIRLDHFRGFEAYWEVPAQAKNAKNGRWVKGPGEGFFKVIHDYLGEVPIIAEDLGVITPEVRELKKKLGFPGMKVLQFALESRKPEEFLPENHDMNTVIYTGTHDNDTILGWYTKHKEEETKVIKILEKYFDFDINWNEKEICWNFIEIVFKSKAKYAVIPLQDILCLGSYARMNLPGTAYGNWRWRFKDEILKEGISQELAQLTKKYDRI